jgi:hypothetical protein
MRNARVRTGAALVFLAVGAACSDDDAAEPAAEARTDAPTTLAADASAGDVDEDAPSSVEDEPSRTCKRPWGFKSRSSWETPETPLTRCFAEDRGGSSRSQSYPHALNRENAV